MKQSSSPARHSLGAIVPWEHFCAHGARKQSGNIALVTVETESRPMANVYINEILGFWDRHPPSHAPRQARTPWLTVQEFTAGHAAACCAMMLLVSQHLQLKKKQTTPIRV